MRATDMSGDQYVGASRVIAGLAARYGRTLRIARGQEMELEGAGWEALCVGVRRYDPTRGVWHAFVGVVAGRAMRRYLYVQASPVSGSEWHAHKRPSEYSVGDDALAVLASPMPDPERCMIGAECAALLRMLLESALAGVPHGKALLRIALGEDPPGTLAAALDKTPAAVGRMAADALRVIESSPRMRADWKDIMSDKVNEIMARRGYMPAAQAAEMTGRDLAHLRRLVRQGKVAGTLVGERALYVQRAAQAEYLGGEFSAACGLDKPLEGEGAQPRKEGAL